MEVTRLFVSPGQSPHVAAAPVLTSWNLSDTILQSQPGAASRAAFWKEIALAAPTDWLELWPDAGLSQELVSPSDTTGTEEAGDRQATVVLTAGGLLTVSLYSVNQANCLGGKNRRSARRPLILPTTDLPAPGVKPRWDPGTGKLYFGRHLVLTLQTRAENMRSILEEFQRQNWRRRIDDPVPTDCIHTDPKRLNSAINKLNRKRKCPLLRFRGDGTGKGVCWERWDGNDES